PRLLGDAPPLPPLHHYFRGRFLSGSDCNLLGSVHLCSKWTLIRSVLSPRMAPIYRRDGRNRTLTIFQQLLLQGNEVPPPRILICPLDAYFLPVHHSDYHHS